MYILIFPLTQLQQRLVFGLDSRLRSAKRLFAQRTAHIFPPSLSEALARSAKFDVEFFRSAKTPFAQRTTENFTSYLTSSLSERPSSLSETAILQNLSSATATKLRTKTPQNHHQPYQMHSKSSINTKYYTYYQYPT